MAPDFGLTLMEPLPTVAPGAPVEVVPAMVERGAGHLVFMASMSGHLPAPKNSLYNATKFGLRGFAQALRMDLRGAGVDGPEFGHSPHSLWGHASPRPPLWQG